MSNVSKGQIQLPNSFQSGETLRADDLERMRKAIAFTMKDMIGGGRGITITQSAGRYIVSARKQRPQSGNPFPLKPAVFEGNKVRFRYGTVHGIVPKIDDTELTASISDEDAPEITVTGAGVIYVKVDLAEDTYEAENPVIEFVAGDASDIPEDVDRESAHQLIVTVEWNDETSSIARVSSAHKGSLDMASCGGVLNYWDLG
jgi:hypothetical protein